MKGSFPSYLPRFFLQFWRKLGRKTGEDLHMIQYHHDVIASFDSSGLSWSLSHPGLGSPTHALTTTIILWYCCNRYDITLYHVTNPPRISFRVFLFLKLQDKLCMRLHVIFLNGYPCGSTDKA